MSLDLSPLDGLLLDDTVKGIPPGRALRLDEVGSQGWNVLGGDVTLPVAVIRESALRHNSAWMQRFVAQRGGALAPHVKTTMCPEIMRRQLDDGAWGVTVATLHQLGVCVRFGARRVILANQLVGRLELSSLCALLAATPDLALYLLADSPAVVAALADAAHDAKLDRPIELLVERGYRGGRTGSRSHDEALAIARAVHAAPGLSLAGIEAFEGLIRPAEGPAEAAVAAFLGEVLALARACREENLFGRTPPLLTAGGSAFYDLVLDRLSGEGLEIVTRSGCYVSHDAGLYATAQRRILAETGEADGLRNALEVWAHVQSRPEPGLAILTAGRRDCGTDAGMPVPLFVSRAGAPPQPLDACEITGLNDQHAYLSCPEDLDLRVGDKIGLGVSHPCTTFDKWQLLYLVDDDYGVLAGLRTFF